MTSPTQSQSYIPALGHDWLTHLYDPAMATLFQERLYRLPLIAALDLQPGQRILDIGCGTGTLDLLLYKQAPDSLVVGLDSDPAALAIAQRKAVQHGASLTLSLASADWLPYANNSFDQVVSSLVLHHLAAAQKARMLIEVWRVLRPGRCVSILDFGPPKASWLVALLTAVAATRIGGIAARGQPAQRNGRLQRNHVVTLSLALLHPRLGHWPRTVRTLLGKEIGRSPCNWRKVRTKAKITQPGQRRRRGMQRITARA